MKNKLEDHGVVAVIVENKKFLLLKDSRKLMLGCWAPPHGRCDIEDLSEEDSVVREVFEETDLSVKPIRKLWTTKADTKVKTASFWLTEIISGKIIIDKNESSIYGWFTLEEAFKLKLYPGVKKFLELVERGEIKI